MKLGGWGGGVFSTLITAGLLLTGCDEPTQLVVVVDSDMEPGAEIEAIDVSVMSEGGGSTTHRFDLADHPLPFSFGITPARADDEPVRIAVTAARLDLPSNVTFSAHTRFVPGETRRLEAPLGRDCDDALGEAPLQCADHGQTCRFGECVDVEVDPFSLPVGPGSDPPAPLFDGPRIAPDAGVVDGGVCVQDEPCELGECAEGAVECGGGTAVCVAVAFAPAGTPCGDAENALVCDGMGRCDGQ